MNTNLQRAQLRQIEYVLHALLVQQGLITGLGLAQLEIQHALPVPLALLAITNQWHVQLRPLEPVLHVHLDITVQVEPQTSVPQIQILQLDRL